jgi:hypothetical protein
MKRILAAVVVAAACIIASSPASRVAGTPA